MIPTSTGAVKPAASKPVAPPTAKAAPVTTTPAPKADSFQTSGASQFYYRGISAGYQVNWTSDSLEAWRAQDMSATEPNYSVKESLEAVCRNPEEGNFVCSGTRRSHARLAAQVGKFLSVEQLDTGYVPGAAHDWGTRYLQTINMDTGKPVKLTDIFPEKAIFQALMNDAVIKGALASPEVKAKLRGKSPTTLTELKEAVAGWVSPDGRFSLDGLGDSFTFHHVKDGKVAVRLSLPHGVEVFRGHMSQLGIYLPIPSSVERDFYRATATEDGTGIKAGMLWSEADKRFGDAESYFELPPTTGSR